MRQILLFIVVGSLVSCRFCFAAQSKCAKPNVVIVLTDDQGYGDLGIHGNKFLKTPHLDRFAASGIQFSRFYCSPVCAPTRASLMTGRYYYRTGVIHTSRGGAKMHGDEVTLAELLSRAGYHTGIFGKWHLGDNYPMRPQDQGFQNSLVHKSGGIGQTPDQPNSYFDPFLWDDGRKRQSKGYCTDVFFDAAMRFIEKHSKEQFFVYIATNTPHTPLEVSNKYSEQYRKKGLKDSVAKIYGMVENIDDNFGRLLAKLDALKLRENTIVIFMSDNGPTGGRYNARLRGSKGTVYEGGLRVPFFVQWPARLKGGRKIDRIAAHIDVPPTILACCGVAAKKTIHDGVSLLPLWADSCTEWPDRLLFFQCHRGLQPQRYQNCAVVTQTLKMIGYPGTFSKEDLRVTDPPILEMYDVSKDPSETKDLAKAMPNELAKLQRAYDRWFDDVKSTRQFQPGVIVVGSPKENPTHLCRYQDGNYKDGVPQGWTVNIVRGGRYDISIRRGKAKVAGKLFANWNGKTSSKSLDAHSDSAIFELSAGRGVLDVWFVENGKRRVAISENTTLGDVQIRRLD